MANVINRTTLQFIESANTPLYPEPEWKANPDLSQVVGVARRYWKWDGVADRPVPMTAQEQADLDAAELTARRDQATASQLDATESVARAMLAIIVDEFGEMAGRFNALLTAIDAASNLADIKTGAAAITDMPIRTLAQVRAAIRARIGT